METNLKGIDKVVFEKLLAKWDEIFQRESIFDEIESVEKNPMSAADVYTAPTFKISKNFKVYEIVRKWPNIFERIFHPIESVCDNLVSEYSKAPEEQELSYETHDGEKKIIFSFTKHIDKYISNVSTIIVNFKFYENSLENENLSINGSEEKVSTLEEYFSAIGKSEFYSHYEDFISKLESKRVALEKNQKEKDTQRKLDEMKNTFDALDNL